MSFFVTDAEFSALEDEISKTNYKTDYFPSQKDVKDWILPNLELYYPFLLFLLEKGVPKNEDEKAAKKLLLQNLYDIEIRDA